MKLSLQNTCVLFFFLLCSTFIFAFEIEKNPSDKRDYAFHILDNGLKLFLISDPETDKAAAALDVWIGSGEDPQKRHGLAHFLEHMLFLGTEKYPEAGESQKFISQHGGYDNAYTSREHTNYYFDIEATQLAPALDRFSQFFIAPLFTERYIERERKVVESEFRAKFDSDSRRYYDVIRDLAHPQHVYAKFGTGNLETLHNNGQTLRQDVIDFYQRYYSSDRMALVVLGREPVETLKKLCVRYFSPIKQKPVELEGNPKHIYRYKLPLAISIKPKKELYRVDFVFPLPKIDDIHRSSLNYISHLVGHESEGSLLSLFKKQGWAHALSAGSTNEWRAGTNFRVSITLTEKGTRHLDNMQSLLLYFIQRISSEGIQRWRYEEQVQLGGIGFRFREKGDAIDEVSYYAGNLHEIPAEKLLSHRYHLGTFDPDNIKKHLGYLNADNLLRLFVSPNVKTDRESRIYKAPYRVEKLLVKAQSSDKNLRKQLAFPNRNEFIPKDFTIVKNTVESKPHLAYQHKRFKLWHKEGSSFDVPKAKIYLRIQSDRAAYPRENIAYGNFYATLLREAISEKVYNAYLAGQSVSFSSGSRGIVMTFSGYSDGLERLLDYVLRQAAKLDDLKSVGIDNNKFQDLLREQTLYWENSAKNSPYQRLIDEISTYVADPVMADERLANVSRSITKKKFQQFAKAYVRGAKVEALIYGNYDRKNALALGKRVQKRLKLKNKPLAIEPIKVAKLTESTTHHHARITSSHADRAVLVYLQAEDDSIESRALARVLAHTMHEPFYKRVRTEKQFGYIVGTRVSEIKQVAAVVMLVQSPTRAVDEIYHEIDAFGIDFKKELNSQFEAGKKAVIVQLQQKPKNLNQSAYWVWDSLLEGDYDFKAREKIVAAVKHIDEKEIGQFYSRLFGSENSRLILYAGTNEAKTFSGSEMISDFAAFKKALPHYIYD